MSEKSTSYYGVDPSVLSPKSDLYPKIWDPKTKLLNHNISLRLKEIAQDFIAGFEYPIKIKDIILTGSIANYNWNQYSDVDLHIVVDFREIPKQYLEAFKDYFNAKKEVWNKNHNISIVDHEVEVYIQDINEPHHSTGVFSILQNKWLAEPSHKDQDIDYEDITSKTEQFIEQINKISDLLAKKDYQRAIQLAEKIKNKIKKYRQAGLEKTGEYSTENLVFKMLRNGGHLESLSNLKRQAYDQNMSIEEEIAIFNAQQTLEEVKKKKKKDACYYKARAKYKVWPSAYASGYLVRCRKKKGKIKEEEVQEEIELDEEILEELSQELDEKKTDFSKEKSKGLHGWFSRQGGKGKSKGWVDCNTCRKDKETGRKICKSCGRQKGEKRGKYPACRPTPSQCTKTGMKNKKSSQQVSWKSKNESSLEEFLDTSTKSSEKQFIFNSAKLNQLNQSIATIINKAKELYGANGGFKPFNPEELEKVNPQLTKEASEFSTDPFNVKKMRDRYYGKGDKPGEIEKIGSITGAEKGLGQMSAGEFEEAGYVIKVPQEVLDDFRKLVESAKQIDGLYEEAKNWYHNIRNLINKETANDRDAALLGMLIAVYSPRAKFALNLAEAIFMYKAIKMDSKENPERLLQYLETFPGAIKRKPGESRGFTGAHKVPNFTLNIIAPELAGKRNPETGKLEYNDLYTWNSTIDTWMIDAFYPGLKRSSTSKEWEATKGKLMSTTTSYRYMARLVETEAKKLDLLPHELQAIIWVSMQVRQTGKAERGVTTQFAFNQIKESIARAEEVKQVLQDAKSEQEEKSWMKTIIDSIDKKGFEGSKAIIDNLRSIVAKGPKGSKFPYWSAGELEEASKKKNIDPESGEEEEEDTPDNKKYKEPEFSDLKTWYVLNNIIQMPTGKFNNLYDTITLYLKPDFSTQSAVDYVTGRFNPEAKASKDYFKKIKENKSNVVFKVTIK